MTSTSAPDLASSQMLQMLNAFLTVQALHVAAALGLPTSWQMAPAAAIMVAPSC
jgi:formate-dependent phosphoribosylglycinamide formyltransferase (GAR transformylase)